VAGQLDVRGAIGIGHSMGAHVAVQTAVLRPETFAALLLADPTIFPRAYYGGPPPDASFTLRRRNRWQSADEMFERFHGRRPFADWRTEILRDYCDFGVLPNGDGYVLACPPAVEASIYLNSKEPGADIYPEIEQVQQPVTVMRAGRTRRVDVFDLSASPTAPDLASHFAHGRDVLLEGASHYIVMEEPERVAEEIRALAAAAGL
jgi:pimeloyl-ACP methyl ester carboxylesterase